MSDKVKSITCLIDQRELNGCAYASQAADEAVHKTFAILGVDLENPEKVAEFQKSLRFNDDLRKAVDKGKITVFVLIVCAGAGLLWLGFVGKIQAMIGHK